MSGSTGASAGLAGLRRVFCLAFRRFGHRKNDNNVSLCLRKSNIKKTDYKDSKATRPKQWSTMRWARLVLLIQILKRSQTSRIWWWIFGSSACRCSRFYFVVFYFFGIIGSGLLWTGTKSALVEPAKCNVVQVSILIITTCVCFYNAWSEFAEINGKLSETDSLKMVNAFLSSTFVHVDAWQKPIKRVKYDRSPL